MSEQPNKTHASTAAAHLERIDALEAESVRLHRALALHADELDTVATRISVAAERLTKELDATISLPPPPAVDTDHTPLAG